MRKLYLLVAAGLGSAQLSLAQEITAWVAPPAAAQLPATEAGSFAPSSITARPAFTYAPPAPVGGRLKGVVELGASGFNTFIVRMDGQQRWQLESAEHGNRQLLAPQVTGEAIRQGLQAYIGRMRDHGVDERDIHFVVDAAEVAGTTPLVEQLRALGHTASVLAPAQEGALAMRAALPAAYADHAFLVDMRAGTTTIGWLDHGLPEVVSTYGSECYQQGLTEAALVADAKAKAAQVPADHRQTCFVLGGVPFELARPLRQGQEAYTVLKPAAECPPPNGARQQAGQALYAALSEATGCQQFVLVWEASSTLGYLLTK